MLVVAGLFLRSFTKLVTLDIGFDRNNVLLINANLKAGNVPPKQRLATFEEIESRLRSLPGVISASRSFTTPISGFEWNNFVQADSPNAPTGEDSLAYFNFISPGYFQTLRTPLLAGREFDAHDVKTAPKVAIVNQTLARKFFPNVNPIGRYLRTQQGPGQAAPPIQIVGLVKDSKYESLREDTFPQAFFPAAQAPGDSMDDAENFELRTATRPSALARTVQDAVAGVNKAIPLEFQTLAEQVDDSLVQERVLAMLSGFFGGLALVLAMIGLYGTFSYLVTQRQPEFGLRMALGAQRSSILWLVMRDVAAILAGGVVAGLLVSLAAVNLLQKLLFGLGARDTVTLTLATVVLAVVVILAGYFPARRATKVDPMVALRYE
jgi:predicted permease